MNEGPASLGARRERDDNFVGSTRRDFVILGFEVNFVLIVSNYVP